MTVKGLISRFTNSACVRTVTLHTQKITVRHGESNNNGTARAIVIVASRTADARKSEAVALPVVTPRRRWPDIVHCPAADSRSPRCPLPDRLTCRTEIRVRESEKPSYSRTTRRTKQITVTSMDSPSTTSHNFSFLVPILMFCSNKVYAYLTRKRLNELRKTDETAVFAFTTEYKSWFKGWKHTFGIGSKSFGFRQSF